MQAIAVFVLLRNQGLITTFTPLQVLIVIASLVAGTIFAMWIGELLTEYGKDGAGHQGGDDGQNL